MVGKSEAAFERAHRYAAIDIILALFIALLAFTTRDNQHILLGSDVDLVGLEPRYSQLDAVVIVAEPDEVERRVILLGLSTGAVLEHVEQTVEPDGGAPVRRKIKSTTHVMSSNFERLAERGRMRASSLRRRTQRGVRQRRFGISFGGFKTSEGSLWSGSFPPIADIRLTSAYASRMDLTRAVCLASAAIVAGCRSEPPTVPPTDDKCHHRIGSETWFIGTAACMRSLPERRMTGLWKRGMELSVFY